MHTQAHFTNINSQIEKQISKASYSIKVAVAWFTDANLFSALQVKANQGCKVTIITSNDMINEQSSIDYLGEQTENFKVYLHGNSQVDLIHHKFCIIDNKTVITGSYNWTNKAKTNQENIVITKGDRVLAQQFNQAFEALLRNIGVSSIKKDIKKDIDSILKRLQIVKNCILLNEFETITPIISKVIEYENTELENISYAISTNNFKKALEEIDNFVAQHKNDQLIHWVDKEIEALRFELKTLEFQLNAYANEKIELEKQLLDYQYRHTKELGDIISELLKFRKYKFKDNEEKFKEAENDENQYNEQVAEEKVKVKFELTKVEQKDLKKKFRKASLLCHPDKVNESMQKHAEQVFIDLKKAYDANDLEAVNEILHNLENNTHYKSRSETITENDKLKATIESLKQKIQGVLNDIYEIKNDETYKTISEIEDFDAHFEDLKERLKDELENLKANVILP